MSLRYKKDVYHPPYSVYEDTEKQKLEKLLSLRFPGLDIEEEYTYNLSYLLRNSSISAKQKSPMLFPCAFQSVRYPEKAKRSTFPLQVDEKPEKQSPVRLIDSRISRTRQPTTSDYHHYKACAIPGPSDLSKSSPSILTKKRSPCSPLRLSKSHEKHPDDGIPVPRGSGIMSPPLTSTVYPGLHIYFRNSSPRGYYRVTPVEPVSQSSKKKTVACDPIITMHPKTAKNNNRAIPSSSPRRDKPPFDVIDPQPDTKNRTKIASRVDALLTSINPKEGHNGSQITSPIPPVERDKEKSPHNPSDHTEYCFVCCKRIYPMDRISIEERVYHKACFKCAICQRTVLPGTFACLDGIILCKPHYIEQFRRRGRYELRASLNKCDELDISMDEMQLCDV